MTEIEKETPVALNGNLRRRAITFNAPIKELFHAISGLFNMSRCKWSENSIQFFDISDVVCKDVIVELLIKGENLGELHAGPKCNRDTFSKVKSAIKEAVLGSAPGIGRAIIFSDEPIHGYYRYRDMFQILPPPADAPKPEYGLEWIHPILLEFAFDKSSNQVINNYRIMKKTYELSCSLNLFLNRHIWARGFTLRKGWVTCDDEETKLCTLIYGYKFPKIYSNPFSTVNGYRPLSAVNSSEYYQPVISLYRRGDLTVPSNLADALDKVFGNANDKIMNVAKRFAIAARLWDISETAAYLASVNTVESLLRPTKNKCDKCNKPIEGPTKAFRDFMNKYTTASTPKIEGIRKKIYDTRSKITHGGVLLGEDNEPYWSSFDDNDRESGHILRCLVREAIINWFTEQQ